jgi:hypothetical protein
MFKRVGSFALLMASIGLLGCSNSPPTGDAHANINLDGKPLLKGSMRFFPLDGKSPTSGGKVQDGKLFVPGVSVGKHRIEIEALIVKPGTPATASVDEVETVQLIPARYNTNSELTWEIVGGLNEKAFELSSR